jgi:cytochrome P450
MIRFMRQPTGFLDECAGRYGDAFTVRFPSIPWLPPNAPIVFFREPDAIRDIFTAGDDALHAGEANVDLKPLLGERSLLMLDGAPHLRERRMMQPPFHGERMLAHGRIMREIADGVIDGWPLGRPFPIHAEMQRITIDVIVRTVFGMADGPCLGELRALLVRLLNQGIMPLSVLLPVELGGLTPWGRFRRTQRRVAALLLDEIAARRAAPAGGADVLSMLVAARDEAGEPMSAAALHDEMITLLVAGHETTATALAWAVHRLLTNPHVLARVRAEVATVAGSRPLEPEHVRRLDYLDATVKETLRLNPIVPFVGRMLKESTRIGGVSLPAGVVAAPCIHLAHRRPDVWPEPDRFEPERFLGRSPSPYTFLPFGGGVRRCLGMAFALYEMKAVLAQMAARVELRPATNGPIRAVPRSITLVPSDGMPVVVESRRPSGRPRDGSRAAA